MNCSNCLIILPTSCVKYDGPTTINLGFTPGMSLNEILLLIDAATFPNPGGNITFHDTSTIAFTGIGTTLDPYEASAIISTDPGNQLVDLNGLYVPPTSFENLRNGLSENSGFGELGGTLIHDTTIFGDGNDLIYEGGGAFGSRFTARTRPTITGTYQQISIDPSNWAVIQNIAGVSSSQLKVTSTSVDLVHVTSADGISLSANANGIDIMHETGVIPTLINHIFLDGRMNGSAAINPNEFVVLSQLTSAVPATTYVPTSLTSGTITASYMNTNYGSLNTNDKVLFTNLSDAPTQILVVTRNNDATWRTIAETKLT